MSAKRPIFARWRKPRQLGGRKLACCRKPSNTNRSRAVNLSQLSQTSKIPAKVSAPPRPPRAPGGRRRGLALVGQSPDLCQCRTELGRRDVEAAARSSIVSWTPANDLAASSLFQFLTEPDVTALVARYGADLPLLEWGRRLRCSRCGSRDCDFVVTGNGGMTEEEQQSLRGKIRLHTVE